MPPKPVVPPELTVGPFRRQDAVRAGLSRHQLASKCWVRLFREVYIHSSMEPTDRVRFDALRLAAPPHAVATGLTAAWLYGIWTPPPGRQVPLHLGLPAGRGEFAAHGVRSGRIVVDEGDLDQWNDIPVTTPERTCFGLMTRASLTEAVVWCDAFLHAGVVTSFGMRRYADERPHWPHVRKVREAVALARAAAASPMETRLRLVVVRFGGLPEPDGINEPVHAEDGSLLGIPDISYLHQPCPRFGVEYDGEWHREATQHAADNTRENRLLVADFPLLRYGSDDVYRHPQRIVAEVAAMLRRAA